MLKGLGRINLEIILTQVLEVLAIVAGVDTTSFGNSIFPFGSPPTPSN